MAMNGITQKREMSLLKWPEGLRIGSRVRYEGRESMILGTDRDMTTGERLFRLTGTMDKPMIRASECRPISELD